MADQFNSVGVGEASQREKLLYLVGRMRQMQEVGGGGPAPWTALLPDRRDSISPPFDQPLDFSASKKIKLDWSVGGAGTNKHDSLGSDGHSDLSTTPSPRSHTEESPRDPPHPSTPSPIHQVPRLNISPPSSPVDSKEGILAPPSLPMHALPPPRMGDMTGLLKLAGIANSMPNAQNIALPPLPLPNLSYMAPKPSYLPPLSSSSPLPLYHSVSHMPQAEPVSELAKIASNSNQKYADFRESMLKNIDHTRAKGRSESSPSSPSLLTSTPNGDKTIGGSEKDEAYWERRRKNNEAAKRSRDARRHKENEIAMRASYLEQENIQLKMELVQLRTELGTIRDQLTRRPGIQAN